MPNALKTASSIQCDFLKMYFPKEGGKGCSLFPFLAVASTGAGGAIPRAGGGIRTADALVSTHLCFYDIGNSATYY